jgi:hypothetical protein
MNYLSLALIFCAAGIVFGLFMLRYAALIISLQIKAAAQANWRIEPISMEKELKNIKASGISLALVCMVAIIYIKFFMN